MKYEIYYSTNERNNIYFKYIQYLFGKDDLIFMKKKLNNFFNYYYLLCLIIIFNKKRNIQIEEKKQGYLIKIKL